MDSNNPGQRTRRPSSGPSIPSMPMPIRQAGGRQSYTEPQPQQIPHVPNFDTLLAPGSSHRRKGDDAHRFFERGMPSPSFHPSGKPLPSQTLPIFHFLPLNSEEIVGPRPVTFHVYGFPMISSILVALKLGRVLLSLFPRYPFEH